MPKKTVKKVKEPVEEVPEVKVAAETPKISLLTENFTLGEVNVLKDKLNEVIKCLNS